MSHFTRQMKLRTAQVAGDTPEMSSSTAVNSALRANRSRSGCKKSTPDGCNILPIHSPGGSMPTMSSNQVGSVLSSLNCHQQSVAQNDHGIVLQLHQQDSGPAEQSSSSTVRRYTRKYQNVARTVSQPSKGKGPHPQQTVSKQIERLPDITPPTAQAQLLRQVKRPAETNTTVVQKSVNVLNEKESREISEEREGLKDDQSGNINKNQSKEPVPGSSTLASTSERLGEIVEIEDTSLPLLSTSLHNYSKLSKGKHNSKTNENLEREESIHKSSNRKMNTFGNADKVPTNLVEQVACFKCKFCLFLSLSQDAVTLHVKQEHALHLPSENDSSMQCPGCSNIFYSQKSLRVHLTEDHNVAQEELESILRTYNSNVSKDNSTQNSLKTCPKVEKQLKKHGDSAAENSQSSVLSNYINSQNIEGGKLSYQENKEKNKTVKKPVKKIIRSNAVEKEDEQQINIPESLPSDETCKIRVRHLSSLENDQKENRSNEFVEIPAENPSENITAPRSEITASTDSQESYSAVPEIHIIETQPETSNGENIQIDIQYDFESMQILDIPIEHNQDVPQEQLLQQINLENSDSVKPTSPTEVDSSSRYCTISASPTSCEAIIDEICQDEGLEHVLYVEEGDLTDDRGSPLMVCFASPSDNENEEGYHIEIGNNDSTSSVPDNKDNEGLNSERMVLTNCTFDGTGLVGTDGKRLVKRGFVKKAPIKKRTPKILSSPRKRSSLKLRNDDSSSAAFKCSTLGCTVRLHSQENMEYHLQCHAPNSNLENEDIHLTEEKGSVRKSKRSRIVPNKTGFYCPECSAEVQTWKQMRSHLWKFHSIDMELYTCDFCAYKTPSLSVLRNFHEKIHGTEKPFLCDSCGKGFKTVKQLRNHKVIHVKGGVGEACEVCGRTFHTNRMLRNHINTVHNKVRPYMCSECGHTAANRSSLKMHLRQHTGDRPYKCDQCDYTSADHNSLRRHKKRHTGDKPYKCSYCSYACIQSSTFKSHLRRKHPGQDSGLVFSCKKCPFHSVSHDMYLAHTAEHGIAEACGIPFKPVSRSSQRRAAQRHKIEEEPLPDEMPIYVSIATDDAMADCESQNFEKIVQHVSEAIVPGSNLHVLYNSISLSDACTKAKKSGDGLSSNAVILRDPIIEVADDESDLEFIAEVNDADAMVEMPSEMKFKLRR